jgi:lysophospholipase L1-like esterase
MWALAQAIATDDWTIQEAQAGSGSDYFPEQLSTLKSIDFDTVDIAVIHYGTNDFGGGVAIGADSTATDHSTLCGALRYSIEKLLTAYPKLRIYISLPVFRFWESNGATTYSDAYQNSLNKTLIDYIEAMRDVAKEYNLPVIDGYYGLGINKANAVAYLSDGTHHNEAGTKRFGTFIGSQIIANM